MKSGTAEGEEGLKPYHIFGGLKFFKAPYDTDNVRILLLENKKTEEQ